MAVGEDKQPEEEEDSADLRLTPPEEEDEVPTRYEGDIVGAAEVFF